MKQSKFLPLGSIVVLNDAEQKLIIIGRGPLFDDNGTIGYFEYSAVLYPYGLQNADELLFFNHEDIQKVIFEGYRDEEEAEVLELFEASLQEIEYPKLSVK